MYKLLIPIISNFKSLFLKTLFLNNLKKKVLNKGMCFLLAKKH